jgi:hypothetical protein
MFNNESQYISIVKYNNQLKIDYKKVNDGQKAFSKESTFIVHDEHLPKDIGAKLNVWQEHFVKSYISVLCLDKNEKIITKLKSKNYEKSHASAYLNTQSNVVLNPNSIEKVKKHYAQTGVDFIFSPFHILNLYLQLNPSKNSLLFFTINNYAYILITDGKSEIIDSRILELSTFEQIQESNFFESEVVGQKLFDEIYYLQLQEAISEAVKDFYNLQNDNFIEKVNILYTHKQLNDEQIQSLQDELMMEIHYRNISVKEALFELSRHYDKKQNRSYINPRKKRGKFLRNFILTLLFLTMALGSAAIYFEHEIYSFLNEPTVKEVQKQSEAVKPKIKLPNHILKNKTIQKEVNDLLSVIPVDALLKSIEVKQNNSIITLNLLKEDTYIKSIQPKILNFYKYSNIQFKNTQKQILDATIYSNEKISDNSAFKDTLPAYIMEDFIPVKQVTQHLKNIFPDSTVIRYKDAFKSEVTTFNFAVITVIDSPKEFDELIKLLNKELYSINISYPLSLSKVSDGIEVLFIVQFHQNR